MRTVLAGAVDFSRHCLECLIAGGHEMAGVVALDPAVARRHGDFADLGPAARGASIPVVQVRDINAAETIAAVRNWAPDVLLVAGWSQLVGAPLREIPGQGCLGTHPSLLPAGRGRHPIVWSLVRGLSEGGLTFFYLDDGADSGDIAWQRPFPISLDDDAASLLERIKGLAGDAIAELWPRLASGTAPRIPQDTERATYWRKRTEQDGIIDWTAPSLVIHNLVRALARPYVGAQTSVDGAPVRVWRAALPPRPPADGPRATRAGAVVVDQRHAVHVRTGDGFLTLLDYEQPAGGRITAATILGT